MEMIEETTEAMRARFGEAFHRYAAEQNQMTADPPDAPTRAATENLVSESAPVSSAERDYRAVRLEYIDRLLSREGAD